jgi:hypothetical protein
MKGVDTVRIEVWLDGKMYGSTTKFSKFIKERLTLEEQLRRSTELFVKTLEDNPELKEKEDAKT